MSIDWGSKDFTLSNLNFSVNDGSLLSAVKMLKAKTKQAFYAAIVKNGVIHRSTWNGCAYNAGAEMLDQPLQVSSIASAANAFGDTPAVVKRFINAWDTSRYTSDEIATQALLEVLEQVGIFTDPDSPTVRKRIVVKTMIESTMSDQEMLDEFKQIVLDDEMNEELAAILAEAEGLVMV